MCRNIKTLANFLPPATEDEIRASALQFVRKLSGTTRPSKANEEVFNAKRPPHNGRRREVRRGQQEIKRSGNTLILLISLSPCAGEIGAVQ